MYMRPEISEETEEMIRDWIKENPDKGIRGVGPAIDYLVPKGIRADNKIDSTEEEIKERVIKDIKDELDLS